MQRFKKWIFDTCFSSFNREMRRMLEEKGSIIRVREGEVRDLRKQNIDLREQNKRLSFELDFERREGKPSIVTLTRALLKGFDPSILNGALYTEAHKAVDVLEEARDEGEEASFLQQASELAKNKALPRIMAFAIRNQVIITAKEATTYEEMNFGRGAINGITIIKDEITRLDKIHATVDAPKPEFDPFKPMS